MNIKNGMEINEKKMQIVIDNYFKQECDVNTSIREAFEKGFRIGVKKGLLSAQPERKKGWWIPGKEIGREFLAGNVLHVEYLNYRCSVCGVTVGERETIMYHYCPNCGAEMKEEENG